MVEPSDEACATPPPSEELSTQDRHRQPAWLVRVAQEPLVHFLVLGVLLFVAARWRDEGRRDLPQEEIVVTEGKILSLAQIFQRTWQRPPTRSELGGIIEDYVNEEVFYREALAMGLDRDDTVIRRRLRQKLEFVAEDLADAAEPTDDQLREFLESHADRYRSEERLSFAHVFFSPQRRGEALDGDVQRTLKMLRDSSESLDLTEFGDPTLLPITHQNLRKSEIANLFGREFIPGLEQAAAGTWAGPIASSYGVHLVRIHDRIPGRAARLDDVREAVRRDWFAQRRAESKQKFYDGLRERYRVTINMPQTPSAGEGPAAGASGAAPESASQRRQ